jgi:hypothetical protein
MEKGSIRIQMGEYFTNVKKRIGFKVVNELPNRIFVDVESSLLWGIHVEMDKIREFRKELIFDIYERKQKNFNI